ncbi:MAG: glycogen synthase GlgA [Candidatus Margulisiibacteriota bacterium]|jgi:starch synthase
MKVVLVSSEVVPFAKTGGLADVAGALPKALIQEGVNVILFMPRYKCVDKKKYNLKLVEKRKRMNLLKNGAKEYNLYSATLPDSDVTIYFIDKDKYFNRDELYQVKGEDYPDNAERFHFFSLAVLDAMKDLDIKADVVHCNDWQTAMIPLFLKTELKDDPFFEKMVSIYTIHNLAYHGLFESSVLENLKLDPILFSMDYLEFWGKVNFAKAGLIFADIISTVSKTYSHEIQGKEFGMGVDGLLTRRKKDIFGIINGLDYDVWDPKIDPKIYKNYTVSTLKGKEENKKKLLELNGLIYKKGVPVLGLISRLTDQKGFDILAEILLPLLQKDIMFVLLGTGDPKYHELLLDFQKQFPDKLKTNLKFDGQLAQMIYAGSDIFLMPSYFEPCGLGQLISLKYGTIPLVRKTGGLADTIIDIDHDAKNGNGYVFDKYQSKDLLSCLERALKCYFSDPKKWQKMQSNGMNADFSWDNSAKKYLEIYQIAKRRLLD